MKPERLMVQTVYMSCLKGYAFKHRRCRTSDTCTNIWLHLTHFATLLSKVKITSSNLLEVVSVHSHVIAVRCDLGVTGRLGQGGSSGQNGAEHQKL